jgi:hypothetical protein
MPVTPTFSRRDTLVLTASLAILAAVPWTVNHWPSQDGPNHLAAAHALLRYSDPDSPFPRYLTVRSGILPGAALYEILCLVGRHVSLETAEKALVSATLLACPLSLLLFVRRTIPRRSFAVFLTLPLVLGWSIAMGFLSFLIAVSFGFVTMAFAWRPCSEDLGQELPFGWRYAIASAALLGCLLFQPVAAVLTGANLLLLEWAHLRRPSVWGGLLLVGGPAAAFLVWSYSTTNPLLAADVGSNPTRWAGPLELIGELFEWIVAYSPWEIAPRAVAIAIAAWFAARDVRARSIFDSSAESSVARLVVALLLLFVVTPDVLSGWYYCSRRFLVFAMFLLPAVAELPVGVTRRLPALAAALTALTLAAGLPSMRRASRQMQDVLDVGRFMARGSKFIPMVFTTPLFGPNPIGNSWALLIVDRDAIAPQLFAAGNPRMGGERLRPLHFAPGILDIATGRLPWPGTETWETVVRACDDSSSRGCVEKLSERKAAVDSVVARYDYVLMMDPPTYAREELAFGLTLRAHVGSAWLYAR